MRIARFIFAASLLLASGPVLAEGPATPARVHYSLQKLHPLAISQTVVASRKATREYIRFRNEQGVHTVIYEEAAGVIPVPAIQHFRSVIGKSDTECRLELDCRAEAFCTGVCRNYYYEASNTPADPALAERNDCTLVSYGCAMPTPLAGAAP